MPRKELQVDITRQRETVTVTLSGEAHFDYDASDEQIKKVLASKPQMVLVDAGRLTFISSVGISFLINLRNAVCGAGGNFKLQALLPQVRKVMEQAHVIHLFDVA